ncbi:HepT-like ribonuclease domain-containing protein [Fulvivirga lutea]|nr:DUF86 domain-containing protein [Fulvivirga lutea]
MNRISEYISGLSFEEFQSNYLVSDAVVRNFEVIGEASKNVPDEIKKRHTELPWKNMAGLRNIIAHQYFGVDYHTLWQIAKEDLPKNKRDLISIMGKEGIHY